MYIYNVNYVTVKVNQCLHSFLIDSPKMAANYFSSWITASILLTLAICAPSPCWGSFRLPDQPSSASSQSSSSLPPLEEQGRSSSILSIFGLGRPEDNDPFVARTSANCVRGDLSECFKSQALDSFDEIFYRELYP